MSLLRRVGRSMILDVRPLRDSVDYRWLYGGQMVALFGRQLTVVAVPYQVFVLTDSSFMVGLIGLAQFFPLLGFSLVGGAVADAVDRRKLLAVSQVLLGGTSLGLALNASSARPSVWLIFLLVAANAGLSAVDGPTRTAVLPALVRRAQLPAAFALNQTLFKVGQAVGPAVAGVLIAKVSLAAAYWIDALSFLVAAALLLKIHPLPPEGGGRKVGVASIMEGLRFLRERRLLQGTFAIDLNAMIFGMPRALFPELGTRVLGGGAATVGLLYAAPGTGALVGALTSGWMSGVRRQGRAVVLAVLGWGAAIVGFGLTTSLELGLVLLALAGAADVVSAVFRNTILQLSVPDVLRGRLTGIHIAVVAGGPRLGDLEAGALAALAGARFSVVFGGVASIVGALLIPRLMPELPRYVHRPGG